MAFRILSLLLCLLVAGPMSTPAWAFARPENRVGKIFSDSPKSAAADLDQTLEPRWENRGCGYDFASGVCKYLYGADDPVNHIDPSGHEYNLITLDVTNYQQQNMRASHGAGLSAGRATALNKIGTSIGITAWLLMNFMDVGEVQFETALPQIPNQEQEEYKELRDPALGFQQYGQCVEYAEKLSQRRSRGRPLFVAYRLKPQYSLNLYSPWGSISSRLSGQLVADNGFHVGVVLLGNVFDNYYSGVPLLTWPLLYEVIQPPGRSHTVTLMRAHGEGFEQLKLFRDAPPRSRYDPRWDSGGGDVMDVPVIE